MLRRAAPIPVLAVALALLAGCGGGEEPIEPIGDTTTADGGTGGAISEEEFTGSADARCAEANAAIANLGTGAASGNLALLAAQEGEITEGVVDSIEALGRPDDPSGALDRYLAALREQVRILGERERAAEQGDTARYEALGGELAQAKADARIAAEEFGFESCGQEASALDSATPVAPGGGDDPGATPEPTPVPAPAPAPAPESPPSSGGTGTGGTDGGAGGGTGDGGGDGGGTGGLGAG